MHSNDVSQAALAAALSSPSPGLPAATPRADLIGRLLADVAPDAPCGENLEYDADFLQLQERATPRAEQQYGDTVIPAETPDWRAIERLALALSARTKDLRVAAYLARSWTEQHGMPGYVDGLAVVAGLLERWWDELHPRLDADGEPDPTPRINALADVAGAHECARAARRQPLFDGGPSVRDAERALDGRDEAGGPAAGSRDSLVAALSTARDDGRVPIDAVHAALRALDAIRARVTDRLGSEWAPDASDTEKALQRIVREMPEPASAVQPAAPDGSTPVAPAASGAAQATSAPTALPNGRAWRDAEVTSRDDVRLGLDKMCRYFELHEPSHPAPLLLRRAQRLLALDFYEIIRDLAPESLPKLDLLSGERSE
ncbi:MULTISPECIES: type VI secretion system protein TssA [unclassified Burkholderia]|uniref:type VI secretion system protein TssA n=1 Tax=unclassified Burkholderia TaxID=2613784 RepID=UPI000F560D9A|nr:MULTISPECIES: type VI secretion system protein TssA [unclassified Burkholderia]RQR32906.1 type VI secretion system protein TssA [Burkholderia sp. Bp9142]RQR50498.1 type VI secretion system protein TssA [Burkholderia sp. Bp9140]